MAVATLEGVQRHNVMACAKHYAMNSIEMLRTKLNVDASERTLREVYLPHFKRAVDGGVASVMRAPFSVEGRAARSRRTGSRSAPAPHPGRSGTTGRW